MSDVNINVDSFVDENVAKNVDIAITDFDVKRNVRIATSFDLITANSFDVDLMNSFDVNIAISSADFVDF